MKQLALLLIFWIGMLPAGQSQIVDQADSSAFEQQRERVNQLLEARSQRFGEFDKSLQEKTGIFGIFKRKKDLQKSIDILREIVLTDNNIFLETKKLLDIKKGESTLSQNLATESGKEVLGYMRSITKLQQENDTLRQRIDALEANRRHTRRLLSAFILVLIAIGATWFLRHKRRQA